MKIWVLHDYKTPQNESTGKPYSSRRLHEEFDCEKRQARTLDFAVYSGNMGEGKELFSYGIPTEWSLFSQNTIVETLWKTVCGKN